MQGTRDARRPIGGVSEIASHASTPVRPSGDTRLHRPGLTGAVNAPVQPPQRAERAAVGCNRKFDRRTYQSSSSLPRHSVPVLEFVNRRIGDAVGLTTSAGPGRPHASVAEQLLNCISDEDDGIVIALLQGDEGVYDGVRRPTMPPTLR